MQGESAMADQFTDEMRGEARAAWTRFIATAEPLRPALARYCRRLTGDMWDAEDLAHDTLVRGFGLLGSVGHQLRSPQAYLLRIATNIWIDAQRRRLREAELLGDPALAPERLAPATQEQRPLVRDAGEALLRYLAPQERAAVLLKDVFDMSLAATASTLGTTVGAVKAALSRGRGRLVDTDQPTDRPMPSEEVIDKFVAYYNARDLPALLALMLDGASIEMTPVVNEFGREGFTREGGWFAHGLNPAAPPVNRLERAAFRGEPLIVQFTRIRARDLLTSLIRVETMEGKVSRIRSYTFCPDAVREVAAGLGLEVGPIFYSFRPFYEAWQPGGAFMPDTRTPSI
jgi:RNA polymerase sigma-70 factor (ECF subfamily)